VENNGFSEDYKRFYFSDIQGIITRKTRRGMVWSIVLACLLASCLAGALFFEREPVRIFFWAVSGVFLAFVLFNTLRGSTCICHILTAVQEEQLPSLNRLRVARRVIGALRGVIEKTQGVLGPEEVNTYVNEGIDYSKPSADRLRRSQARRREIRHDDGAMHMIAFALLLADGALIAIDLLHHTRAISIASYALGMTYSIGIIIALVKQRGSDVPAGVRRVAWFSLGFVCISSFLIYVVMVTALMGQMVQMAQKAQDPQEMMTQWDMYQAMLELSPQDSPFLIAVYMFSAAGSFILGALGLVRVKKHRDDSARARHGAQYSGRGVTA
jgi:hypothetical protein